MILLNIRGSYDCTLQKRHELLELVRLGNVKGNKPKTPAGKK